MTPTGKLIMIVYSIIVVGAFIIRDLKRGDKGWRGALLVPILILLLNM